MANRPEKKKSRKAVRTKPTPGQEGIPNRPGATYWQPLLWGLLIAAAVWWIYWPVRHGTWLMDDAVYFTANPLLQDPERLWKAWFEPGSFIEYYPVEETVQWIQWQLWHGDTLGYHVTNILLHIVDALLVWKLLSKFRLKLAWLGGLIFAVHPVQVESVAWIMELKNTLSLAPFLLAMCAWIDYDERRRPWDYGLSLGLFLVAMLCKISMAPFPVILLLYAWWKRGRIGWSDLRASVPFLAIALILGMTTLWAGDWYRESHPQPGEVVLLGGFFSRMACVGLSLSFYFSKFFLPVGLAVIYPLWSLMPPSSIDFLPWPFFGAVLYICWKKRSSWGRHALLGLGFFGLNLVPFIGFMPASYMSATWVMDHFLYLPVIGLIGLVVAGLGRLETLLPQLVRYCGIAIVAAAMAGLAWHSRWYAGMFINLETLWTCVAQVEPGSWLAHNNLGYALAIAGRNAEAIEEFEKAASLNPNKASIYNNLGLSLLRVGRTSDAVEQFRQAVRIDPDFIEARNNLLQNAQKSAPVKD